MNEAKEDLLLHPVRLRVIQSVAGRELTAREIASELPDVPQATLYRHLKVLSEAGVLAVVRERRVRNTSERTYALPDRNQLLGAEDLEGATQDDLVRLFTRFAGGLLGYYVRYVQRGGVDFAADRVVLRAFPMYLTAAERDRVDREVNAALMPFVDNGPSSERQRYVFGLVALPDSVAPSDDEDG